MNKRHLAFAAPLLVSLLRADYPVASHRYLADPSVLVTPERVYVYCSNDDESPVEGGYNIPNVVCVSSSDMKNWTDHGVVFEAARQTTWAKKTWAPAAIERDGKYFLYFGNGGANIGVVVGDSPVGPFRDVLGRHLIDSATPGVKPYENMWLFDPGVFIDDDGQAYMYFGGNGENNVRIARLKRDMISLDGVVLRMSAPAFFEAAWVFKREGVYYFAYSTNPKAGLRIDYMTSRSPVSGFEYKGVLADQPPINNNNNHSSEFLFKGTWYHVYHNRIVAKNEGIPGAFRRNLALETLTFRDDGSIEPVRYTEDGVRQVGHVNPFQRVEAETFASQQGVETAPVTPGGLALVSLQPGDWTLLRGVDFGAAGSHVFEASVAADQPGATLEVRLGGPEGSLLGVLEIPATGGLQNWRLTSVALARTEGVADLCLKVGGISGPAIAVDHWRLR